MLRRAVVLVSCAAAASAACENVTWEPRAAKTHAAEEFVHRLHRRLHHRDDIASLIGAVSEGVLLEHALQLSGEGPGSAVITRNSNSHQRPGGIDEAVDYVSEKMRSYGFEVETHPFRSGWGPNVIATLSGAADPADVVVMGAHLDSRNANSGDATGRAPGGNDDGSGSAALLATGEAIHRSGASFRRTVVLEWYSGEEQGLVGSRALAARRQSAGERVVAMFQQDMTAVRRDGDAVGVAMVQDGRSVDQALTDYAEDVAKMYAGSQLTVHRTVLSGSNCCSDHQSYAENGFPSVGYIEPRGYTGDPQYHKVGDTVERADYSPLQATLAARVALAAAADTAGLLHHRLAPAANATSAA